MRAPIGHLCAGGGPAFPPVDEGTPPSKSMENRMAGTRRPVAGECAVALAGTGGGMLWSDRSEGCPDGLACVVLPAELVIEPEPSERVGFESVPNHYHQPVELPICPVLGMDQTPYTCREIGGEGNLGVDRAQGWLDGCTLAEISWPTCPPPGLPYNQPGRRESPHEHR